jgi:hypothetical protein
MQRGNHAEQGGRPRQHRMVPSWIVGLIHLTRVFTTYVGNTCVRVFERSRSISSLDPPQIVSNITLAHSHFQFPTSHRGKYSPGDTTQEFSNPQDLNIRRKEDDEDESCHGSQVDQHDLSMAVLGREVTVQQSSDDVANSSTVLQAGLPSTGEMIAILRPRVEAIFLLESWVCEETAYEGSVVALRDNGSRHHDGPENSFLVRFDGLPEAETMLGGRRCPGILVQAFVMKTHIGVVDVLPLDIVDVVLDVRHRHDEARYKEDVRRRLDAVSFLGSNERTLDSVGRGA